MSLDLCLNGIFLYHDFKHCIHLFLRILKCTLSLIFNIAQFKRTISITIIMSDFNFDPKGRKAIVTGGAQGIGSEFARQLVGAGAKVCICDIDTSVGVEFAEKLRKEYGVGKDRCNDR